jgi:hypothetical protein
MPATDASARVEEEGPESPEDSGSAAESAKEDRHKQFAGGDDRRDVAARVALN